jgi:hypothetical protein
VMILNMCPCEGVKYRNCFVESSLNSSNTCTLLVSDFCSAFTMKVFAFLAFAALECSFLCEAATSLLHCNADNCLRVMTNTPYVASSMCSTYIASTTVTTVTPTVTVSFTNTILPTPPATIPANVVPSHISSQCILGKSTPPPP